MTNHHRGEISAVLGGRPRRLRLTLGALAELEAAHGVEGLAALAKRFESGALSARDLIGLIGAGLRGAGEDIDDRAAGALAVDGGVAAYAGIAADLLAATFGASAPDAEGPNPPSPQDARG